MRTHVISAMLCLATAPLCMAAGEPAAGAQDCTAISDAAARLACFDAAAARSRAPDAAPASAPAPQTPPPASSASSLGEEQLRNRNTDRDAEERILKARISESRRGAGGVYLLTLDNGHVWRHEQGSMAAYLKVGEAVTISPASLGSYRLTLDSGSAKNWVRVTRVR